MRDDTTNISDEDVPTFARYRALRPIGTRGALRGAVLSTLALAARAGGQLERYLTRPRVQFIYLHHVFRDEEANFRRLLADLARHHAFIGHTEAFRRVRAGDIDRAYISVSFDDGFADNLVAATILEEFGARGCFYVCPAIVGERDRSRLEAFCAQRLNFPLVTPFLDWDDLATLVERGHEVGAHTMTHPNLGEVTPGEAQWEIAESRAQIVRYLGGVQHFAWPRGQWRHFNAAARDVVFRDGFQSCASAVRGCHVMAADGPAPSVCLRRDHVFANWPLDHVRFLLMRNSMRASRHDNRWPDEYMPVT